MTLDEACGIIAFALNLDQVSPEDSIATLPSWDSLGHMRIILAVEEQLGAELTGDQIASIGSVRDIAAI